MARQRIIVVGAGHLGNYHLQKLSADPEAELVGLVEPHPERRAEMQARYRVPGAATLGDFRGRADAAVIASPTPSHLEVGLEALLLGWDVLIEKPLALTPSAGGKIVAAAQANGRFLQVGHTERFNPAVAAALAVADRPGYIVAERLGPFSGRSADVDVVLDLMIHDLDIVALLVKAPLVEVRAVGVPVLTHEVDMAAARLAFADGTVAQLSAGRASLEPVRKIRLFTRERYLSIDCQNREVKSVRRLPPQPGSEWPQITGEPIDVPAGDALALQDHDFVVCVRDRRQPRVDGNAGLRALQLAAAVKEAMRVPAYPETGGEDPQRLLL
jgi:predicted dehydrogenase